MSVTSRSRASDPAAGTTLSLPAPDRRTVQGAWAELMAHQRAPVLTDWKALNAQAGAINIVPQSQLLNRGDWKAMENFFRNELGAGKEVSVKIDVGYPAGGGVRPANFLVTATIDGKVVQFPFKQ